jgi:RNA polymerase sigma-70 factor (family 1)
MEILLKKIQYNSDQIAFRQLYEMLFLQLFRFSIDYVASKEIAEELVNDVFLNIWQKRGSLDLIENIKVYLYTAVRNASWDYREKSKKKATVTLDNGGHNLSLGINPESILISRELQAQIDAAINQLPPQCKLIFRLVKEDKLTYKEVADILQISSKTVDSQLCIALKKLAVILQPVYTLE